MTVKPNHLDRPGFPPLKSHIFISSTPELKSLAPQGEFKRLHALLQG